MKNVLFGLIMICCSSHILSGANNEKTVSDIETTFNKLDTNDENKLSVITNEFLEKSFNLDDPQVSEYMLKKINSLADRSGKIVLGNINKINPQKGFIWIINNYDKISFKGKINLLRSLCDTNCAESYELLFLFINDKREVKLGGEEGAYALCRCGRCNLSSSYSSSNK